MLPFYFVIPALTLSATRAVAEPDTITLTMEPSSLTLPKDHPMFELPTESQRKNLGFDDVKLITLSGPNPPPMPYMDTYLLGMGVTQKSVGEAGSAPNHVLLDWNSAREIETIKKIGIQAVLNIWNKVMPPAHSVDSGHYDDSQLQSVVSNFVKVIGDISQQEGIKLGAIFPKDEGKAMMLVQSRAGCRYTEVTSSLNSSTDCNCGIFAKKPTTVDIEANQKSHSTDRLGVFKDRLMAYVDVNKGDYATMKLNSTSITAQTIIKATPSPADIIVFFCQAPDAGSFSDKWEAWLDDIELDIVSVGKAWANAIQKMTNPTPSSAASSSLVVEIALLAVFAAAVSYFLI